MCVQSAAACRARWVTLVLPLAVLAANGCSNGSDENQAVEVTLALINVNTLPSARLDLRNSSGASKSWHVAGGQSQTGPIDLALTGPDVEVLVTLAKGEEIKVTPSQGLMAGNEKPCRRRDGAATRLEVRVADLDDVRCTGNQWEAPDPVPAAECVSPVIFQDHFEGADNFTTTFTQTGGSSHTATLLASGGNSLGYRHMVHVIPAPGPYDLFVEHLYTGGSYDPGRNHPGALFRRPDPPQPAVCRFADWHLVLALAERDPTQDPAYWQFLHYHHVGIGCAPESHRRGLSWS